jgi:hypothetical protein
LGFQENAKSHRTTSFGSEFNESSVSLALFFVRRMDIFLPKEVFLIFFERFPKTEGLNH